MKKILSVFAASLLLGALTTSTIAEAASKKGSHSHASGSKGKGSLSKVCPRTVGMAGVKWKAQPSDHITTGSRVNGISLIFQKGTSIPFSSCLPIYDSAGTSIAQLGLYERNGKIFGARYYSGVGCAAPISAPTLANSARSKSGSTAVYIQTRPGLCLQVRDAGHDEGAVR